MMQTTGKPAISAQAPKQFPLLQPLLSRLMGTSEKYDILNVRNAHRWYCIALESLENGDHKRMRDAVTMLAALALVNKPNRHEAREYLSRIIKDPGSSTYAAKTLQTVAVDAMGVALEHAKDPEAAFRLMNNVITEDMGPLEKMRHLNNLLAQQLWITHEVPENQRARFLAIHETANKMLGELLARVEAPANLFDNPEAYLTITMVSTTHQDFAQKLAALREKWELTGIKPSN